jgi:uncharacterized DUF497 family protein
VQVTITFDPLKRDENLRKHGLDFLDAVPVFEGRTLDREDIRRDYGETRMQTVGFLSGRMVMVVWTQVGSNTRRVISMRKCNAREQADYSDRFKEA